MTANASGTFLTGMRSVTIYTDNGNYCLFLVDEHDKVKHFIVKESFEQITMIAWDWLLGTSK